MFSDFGLLTAMDLTRIQKPVILVKSIAKFSPINANLIIMQPYRWIIPKSVRY
jgi:hypothetical protein